MFIYAEITQSFRLSIIEFVRINIYKLNWINLFFNFLHLNCKNNRKLHKDSTFCLLFYFSKQKQKS